MYRVISASIPAQIESSSLSWHREMSAKEEEFSTEMQSSVAEAVLLPLPSSPDSMEEHDSVGVSALITSSMSAKKSGIQSVPSATANRDKNN